MALTWTAAAGLAALPSVWPSFRQYMTAVDGICLFAAGWISRENWVNARQRKAGDEADPEFSPAEQQRMHELAESLKWTCEGCGGTLIGGQPPRCIGCRPELRARAS